MKQSVLKYVILISTAYAMVRMWHWKIGFTFFTQLSNLYGAAVVLCQLVSKRKLAPVKLTAAVSLTVTALMFLLFIAPAMPGGIAAAYMQDHCASLCLHGIIPVLTVVDYLLNDRDYDWKIQHLFYCTLPPLCWFCFILILGALGIRWFGGMTAPYPFLNYAGPAGWFGFAPKSIGPSSMGIGVSYVLLVMSGLFVMLARIMTGKNKR